MVVVITTDSSTIVHRAGVIAHGIFRTPNLKARLTNYHEEFRAVWRGYHEHA